MKLLTLNTHRLVEDNYPQKLNDFVNAIALEQPEIIALQEVNQTIDGTAVSHEPAGYFPCAEGIVIREDNHVYNVVRMLRERGINYHWTWLPIKKGYGCFDEGLALMSRSPILETEIVTVSGIDDRSNWKTRKLLGIRTQALSDEWFFSVHYGWWSDTEEPFREQWIRTAVHMTKYDFVWLMGDFNAPADVRGEGYDLIKRSYWQDTYDLAENKDSGVTVGRAIDGWRDNLGGATGMRIDQIWCNTNAVVTDSRVIFNGAVHPVVSDHFGVMINYERSIV